MRTINIVIPNQLQFSNIFFTFYYTNFFLIYLFMINIVRYVPPTARTAIDIKRGPF